MRMLTHGGPALRTEAALLLAVLRDRRLALLLVIFAALLALAAQAPLRYRIEVGQEDGPGGDLPLVAGFWPFERDAHGDFRWTTERATIRLPGVGQRALAVTLAVFPVNEEVSQRGARELELWSGGRLLGRLPVRQAGAIYHVLLPPPVDWNGNQALELRSATFVPTGDQRAIGVPVDAVTAVAGPGPVLPAWRSMLGWLGAALLGWLALRRAGFGSCLAARLLLAGVLLAGLAALLDPPRFALGAGPALTALALGWLLVLMLTAAPEALSLAGLVLAVPASAAALGGVYSPVLPGTVAALLLAGAARPVVAALGRRLGVVIAPGDWRWLALIALLVFATRYGGKIYPDSMPGDIGFHINRYNDTVRGNVLLLSRNRGVDFPYPPALYVLLAPFSLLGLDQRVLLQFGGALLDALSPFLVYVIAGQIQNPTSKSEKVITPGLIGGGKGFLEGRPPQTPPFRMVSSGKESLRGLPPQTPPFQMVSNTHNRLALLAAGIYSFSAAGLMTTWWNFSTHIFAQFAHLLLIAALVMLWRYATDHRRPTTDDRPLTLVNRESVGDRGLEIEEGNVGTSEMRFSILDPPSSILAGLVVLQALVYLGHFGFWINMSLLGATGLAVLVLAALRGRVPWALFRRLLAAFLAAEGFAALCFYSGYTELFLAQIVAARQGGLTGLAGREAADPALLWRTLWDAGFRVHFGLFPLPLALCGLLLLLRRPTTDHRPPTTDHQLSAAGTPHVSRFTFHAALVVLMIGTFVIALIFASLPFLSGSTLSTRWLMFSAWVIAVGAAVAAQILWRAGRAGRLLLLAAGGYMVWVTASMWLAALAWRVRPPEPF